MKCLFIHMSDIHFLTSKDDIFIRKDVIFDAIKNEILDKDAIFFVVTGDIAYSGTADQYKVAVDFFTDLENQLKSYNKIDLFYIFVPGNHDCNHGTDEVTVRQIIINQVIQGEKIDKDIIKTCCKVQDDFRDFIGLYNDLEIKYEDNLLRILEYSSGNFKIVFNCYNTAWLSQKSEQIGKLFYPLHLYDKELFSNKADLVISLFHHPFSWLSVENRRLFDEHNFRTSDIVLTGHEHESSVCCVSDLQKNTTEYIEGEVLQDSANKNNSGFSLIHIDLGKNLQKICTYKYEDERYRLVRDSGEIDYKRSANMTKKAFQVNEWFEKFLNDPGANFAHTYKPNLILNDIYVFPQLIDISNTKLDSNSSKQEQHIRYSAETLCNLDGRRKLILGEEKSGKTALSKMLFKNYYDKYVPIYIEGYKIKDASFEAFNKILINCFSEQYQEGLVEDYNQLDKDKKVIIIDNFDKIKLNSKHFSILISNISKYYSNLILVGSNLFQIEEIISRDDEGNTILDDFDKYEIIQFGHLLRAKLTDKWNTLGREEFVHDAELIRINDNAERIINTIIGKNFVPSYPIFLLTILQTIEVGKPHDLRESSYGYYYQFLITQALSRINIKHDEIDAYNSLLTELSNYMYEKESQEISKEGFLAFHNMFCKDYKVSSSFSAFVNPDILLNKLTEVNILEEYNGIIKFRYKYAYYYFVGKYIHENIADKKIQVRISFLCKKLHIEEFANVFMFLIHHSKNPLILDEILLHAMSIFEDFSPVTLSDDIKTVNNLLDEVPRLVLENRDVKKTREDKLKQIDQLEFESKVIEREKYKVEAAAASEDINQQEELDLASKLNYAFKTIEILGQILKNYWGSLKGDKQLELAEETYFIGLRALSSFFSTLEDSTDYIVHQIENAIERHGITDKKEIEKKSKRILFRICNEISYFFIKKVSSAIGYEKLSETFNDILKRNDTIAVKLIDLAIKLDFYREIPFDDISKIKNETTNNYSTNYLLRRMLIEYIYMFKTSFKEKQKICELLDIPINTQLAIDQTSPIKKER